MRHLKYMLLLFVALLTSACRDEAPELMNPNERQLLNTPSQVFESFWHGMNNSYVFWDIDPTDWDKVYDDYLPRFRELDKLETVKTETLQELYDEMNLYCTAYMNTCVDAKVLSVNGRAVSGIGPIRYEGRRSKKEMFGHGRIRGAMKSGPATITTSLSTGRTYCPASANTNRKAVYRIS